MDPDTLLSEHLTSAGVAAALALRHVDPHQTHVDTLEGVPVLLSQPDVRIHSIEHLLPEPKNPRIDVNLYTKQDLVAYLKAQTVKPNTTGSTAESCAGYGSPAIFADRQKLSFTAILDYHQPGVPSWCRHTVRVAYQHSHQFNRWKEADNEKMDQEEFATFLDENVNDIINPTGADVVSFATQLEVTRTEKFKSHRNLSNGEVAFTFTNESTGDSTVKFPTEMTLSLPIWINGDRIALKAKLFYRVIEGSLTFWFKLMMLEETIDHLFGEDTDWMRTEVGDLAQVYTGPAPAAPTPHPIATR